MRQKKTRKRSPIWQMPEEEFIQLWENAESITDVLKQFDLEHKGGNGKTLAKRVSELGLNNERFKGNPLKALKKWRFLHPKQSPEEIFATKKKLQGRQLKEALLAIGRPEECEKCKQKPNWNGEELNLPIDHKDGNTANNREENLRILCPNCHSQTSNFCGRKNKIDKRKNRGIRLNTRKVERPDVQALKKLLWEEPTIKIATRYGVSDKAIEKWAKSYKVAKPPVGYWNRKPEEQGKIRQKMLNNYDPNK